MALYLIAEEGDDPEEQSRNEESQHDGSEEDDEVLGLDLTLEERLVDEFSVVGSGGQGDAVLLTLLQEEHVKGGLHVLLTAHLVEHTLLDRGCRHTALELREL